MSAFYLLKRRHIAFATASLKVGLAVAAIATVSQIVLGDVSARVVAKHQPEKFAAMEGLYESRSDAALSLFGWVDTTEQRVVGVEIDGLLPTLLGTQEGTVIKGLRDLPDDEFLRARHRDVTAETLNDVRPQYWPHVQSTFQLYHLMVAIAFALLFIVIWGLIKWKRGTLCAVETSRQRLFLWVLVFSVLGPQIANQAGWFVAEIGRQPWIVYGLLKTSQSLSKVVTASQVGLSLVLFFLVYLLLFAAFIYLLTRKIQHGPDDLEQSEELPESWRAMIRRRPVEP
jgi:cytochrome d ubiquinol oxidase subunit I